MNRENPGGEEKSVRGELRPEVESLDGVGLVEPPATGLAPFGDGSVFQDQCRVYNHPLKLTESWL